MPEVTRRLAELRAPEVAEFVGPDSIVIQPLGAIEQHGAHLPFNTDLVTAEAAASALVAQFGDIYDLWLLPSLNVSKSNEHDWAPGTLSLSARTLLSVVEDVADSVANLGVRKFVFLNGHGGNSSLLNVACREIRLRNGLATFLVHPMVPPDQGGASALDERGMGIHGGFLETSLMLYLAPDNVRMDLAEANVPDLDTDHVRFGGPVTFGWASNDFGSGGIIGDPTAATREVGAAEFESIIDSLGRAMGEIARFEYPAKPVVT